MSTKHFSIIFTLWAKLEITPQLRKYFPGTPGGTKVLNIQTQGGKIITTPRGSSVVTVNPKTLHLTAVKNAAGISGKWLPGILYLICKNCMIRLKHDYAMLRYKNINEMACMINLVLASY